jgi:hypothetical protein
MTKRRLLLLLLAWSSLGVCLSVPLYVPGVRAAAEVLPSSLADEDFWQIVSDFSEPAGTFQSDNLVSNERRLQEVVPDLAQIAKPNRVYVGVGPEQNFTYIAALRPKMAFIVDIRRGNKNLHLMYKALFELSADRAEFVSRLFSRRRPDGLSAKSSVTEIFDSYENVESSEALYTQNLRAIVNHLVKAHRFALSGQDLSRLLHIYTTFRTFGPALQYSSTQTPGGRRRAEPTYRDLMLAADLSGEARSYLSSEETFAFVKNLETANLIVPLMGDFAGPKAIRAVGEYLRDKSATVSAFYVSNVEEYLRQDDRWQSFCANVAALPIDDTSTFIRSVRGREPNPGAGLNSELGAMVSEVKSCRPF